VGHFEEASVGVVYTGTFQAVAATAAQDLFELLAPSARSVKLLEVHVTQSTEVGDAQAEMLRFAIKRATGAVTSGSGGTTVTAAAKVPGLTYSGTLEANNTTRITGGTVTVLEEEDCHMAQGFHHLPPQGREGEIEGATRLVVGLEQAPADSVSLSGTITYEVVGGV
jgi:hypothetical protein